MKQGFAQAATLTSRREFAYKAVGLSRLDAATPSQGPIMNFTNRDPSYNVPSVEKAREESLQWGTLRTRSIGPCGGCTLNDNPLATVWPGEMEGISIPYNRM
jgi:hypothetical protein